MPVGQLSQSDRLPGNEPLATIALTGAVGVRYGVESISLSLKKSSAIITVMALSVPTTVSREKLAAMFWSDKCQNAARGALRQTLHKLKHELQSCPCRILDVTPDSIGVVNARVDLVHALSEASEGRIVPPLAGNPHAFLDAAEGLDHVDPIFASWIAVQRQRMHEDAIDSLSAALAEFPTADQHGVEIARHVLRMEPTHEASCRYLMRSYYARGQVSVAHSVYRKLWHVLDDEFDSSPSEETQNLIVDIKCSDLKLDIKPPVENAMSGQGVYRVNNPRDRIDPHRLPVLWVLPIDESDLDRDDLLIALGLRNEFVSALCRFREWRVFDDVSATTPPFQPNEATIYTLSTVTITIADTRKFVIHLRDAATQEVIWSESIVTGADLWSRLQQRAVMRIATALRIHLSRNRLHQLGEVAERGQSIHGVWLTGQALLTRWGPESETQAEALFRDVIGDQPDFAPAHTGIAEILNTRHLICPGILRSKAVHNEALKISLRAIELDPLDAKGQLALAWSLSLNGSWNAAAQAFDIARTLNGSDSWIIASAALGFAYCGEIQESNLLLAQLSELSVWVTPLQRAYQSGVFFLAEDYEGALLAADLAVGTEAYIGGWRCATLAQSGDIEAAKEALQIFYACVRDRWHGEIIPTDEAIVTWLLQCYPIRGDSAWLRFRDGLSKAGAPVPASRSVLHR